MSSQAISRRISHDDWKRAYPGVYLLWTDTRTWEQALIAAWFWTGQRAVVSHRAAAALWRLDGIEPGWLKVSSPHTRRSPSSKLIIHRTRHMPLSDLAHQGHLRVTDVSRTLMDLGAVVSWETVETALDSALRGGLCSVARLTWRLDQANGRGKQGAGRLRELVQERAAKGATESALETRFLRIMKRAKLPEAIRQHPIRDGGRLIARVDFAYPHLKVAVEVDGYSFHSSRSAFQKDRARDNSLQALGWKVLRFTSRDLNDPAQISARIERALVRRLPI